MRQSPTGTEEPEDPVVRVLGAYLASVVAAVATFMLLEAVKHISSPPVAVTDEVPFPNDWFTVALSVSMVLLIVGLMAFLPFLLCLAISVCAGIRHPAFHVACGCAIGLTLWGIFSSNVDEPILTVIAGAVGGAVYWRLAVRDCPSRPGHT